MDGAPASWTASGSALLVCGGVLGSMGCLRTCAHLTSNCRAACLVLGLPPPRVGPPTCNIDPTWDLQPILMRLCPILPHIDYSPNRMLCCSRVAAPGPPCHGCRSQPSRSSLPLRAACWDRWIKYGLNWMTNATVVFQGYAQEVEAEVGMPIEEVRAAPVRCAAHAHIRTLIRRVSCWL